MSDDIKLNGQCMHGYPADGTCPYCHPAKDRPEKHDRDDIKKAAEIEIAVNDKGDRSVFFARAYLALREQVERQGWIDIKDKLPPNGDPVLCSGLDWGKGPSRHYEVASFDGRQFYRGREEGEISDLDECPYITHWMPLPKAPTALPPDAPEPTPSKEVKHAD